MIALIVSLVTGAVGGLLAGHFIKNISLGNLYNGICGILGGGVGGAILGMVGIGAGPSGALTVPAVVGSVASGLVGGTVVLFVVGLVFSMVRKTA